MITERKIKYDGQNSSGTDLSILSFGQILESRPSGEYSENEQTPKESPYLGSMVTLIGRPTRDSVEVITEKRCFRVYKNTEQFSSNTCNCYIL